MIFQGVQVVLKRLFEDMIAAIANPDPAVGIANLQAKDALFLDPIEGAYLHAEALYTAIRNKNVAAIRHLLNLSVRSDIAFFRFCGNTPLGLAIEENYRDIIPAIMQKTDRNFAFHMAVTLGQEKVKRLLLKSGAVKERLLKLLIPNR